MVFLQPRGGEQYLTIGNFFEEGEIQTVPAGNSEIPGAYYYVDNVCVAPLIANTEIQHSICEGTCFDLGGLPFCEAGTYTVDINEICPGSPGTITVVISSAPNEEVVIAPVSEINCYTPEVALDGSGSTGLGLGTSYWTGPDDFYSTNTVVAVSEPGTYSFYIPNSLGCVAIDSVLVTVNDDPPGLSIDPWGSWDCVSSFTTLIGNSNTPGATYQWVGPGTNETTSTVMVEEEGTYVFTVTGTNGCTATGEADLAPGYFFLAEANVEEPTLLGCNDYLSTFLIGSSNSTDVTYLWTGPGLNETEPVAETEQPGVYTFTVTSPNGCSNSSSVEVIQDIEVPDVVAYVATELDCELGTIYLEGYADSPGVSYNWSGPGIDVDFDGTPVTQEGIYIFTVTSIHNSCTGTDEIIITEEQLAIPTILDIQTPTVLGCNGSSVVLYGEADVSGASYLWTGPGLNDPNQLSAATTPGVYILTATCSKWLLNCRFNRSHPGKQFSRSSNHRFRKPDLPN